MKTWHGACYGSGIWNNHTLDEVMMKHRAIFALLVSTLFLGGCVFAPGDRDDDGRDRRQGNRPTVGQELLDLDRAHDAGVISTGEYDRAKADLLDSIN